MNKTLQDLTIKDSFMFAAAMSNTDRSREFLTLLLGIDILEISVVAEKTLVYHPEYHGIRLDVLAIENGTNRHFDIEMQIKDKKNLPKRSRYYHSQMDMDLLLAGHEYNELPSTYVIFICDYDPLGQNLYRYTIENKCEQTDETIDDGSTTIWLNVKGTNDADEPAELVEFLKYVRNPFQLPASSSDTSFTRKIDKQVTDIKQNRNWRDKYMLFEEMLNDELTKGITIGMDRGMKLGMECGQLIGSILTSLSFSGSVPESLRQRILDEQDIDTLNKWCTLAKSATVEEFEQHMFD